MTYEKQFWEDAPSTASPISAERLNHMEEGISGALAPIVTSGLSAVDYGDSIVAAGGFQPYITERLNLDVHTNRGVSGRPMADGTANGAGTVTTVLSNIDHALFDLGIIVSGTNDFRLNVPIGTLGTWATVSFDRTTFLGAYRVAVDHILSQNPDARIVLCTPLKRNNAGYTDESTNTAGHKLRDYAQAVRDLGAMYALPVCDSYLNSGFNQRTLSTLTTDGLHPNSVGNARLGRFMGDFIASILGIPTGGEPPLVPLLTDTFSRADSTTSLGVADTGQTWMPLTANGMVWGIADGDAYQSAAGSGFMVVDVGQMDVRVEAIVGALGVGPSSGIGLWVTDENNGVYLVVTPSGYTLARRSGGVNTNIATAVGVTPANGDNFAIEAEGTVIRAFVSGVQFATHPNLTAPARTSKVGLWGAGTQSPRIKTITAWPLA